MPCHAIIILDRALVKHKRSKVIHFQDSCRKKIKKVGAIVVTSNGHQTSFYSGKDEIIIQCKCGCF